MAERYLKIDKAIYRVDDASKTYRFHKRNPDWQNLDPLESLRNEKQLEGYTRIFTNGRTRVFRFNDAPSRAVRERRLRNEGLIS